MIITGSAREILLEGAISFEFISGIIQQHAVDKSVGAYSVFMGQVRNDEIGDSRVKAIEYTAHTELVQEKIGEIRRFLSDKYPVSTLHVYHSIGVVAVGEICFFVLATSGHRNEAIRTCEDAVSLVKSELPIWGKLILDDNSSAWKENH